ncbi:MAG: sialate O-acetylesterase [Bacteroidales bacterium]
MMQLTRIIHPQEIMKSFLARFGTVIFLLILLQFQLHAEIRLPAIIGDGMVLQRDESVKIWGWAEPGERVTVKFKKGTYKTDTGKDGKWMIKLPPMLAGGPYDMEIRGTNKIIIKNILVGDVWICSGQSNMTHNFGRHRERYAREIAGANIPEIRQFLVPTNAVITGPIEDAPSPGWKEATSETVLDFTVIGYFFAKKLYDRYHIPMGIINASVGGTPIEAWTSENGLKEFSSILATIEKNKDTAYVNSANRKAREAEKHAALQKTGDKGITGAVTWYDPSHEPLNWKRINIPGYWEDQGIRNLDGVVWYRREIDVPESMTELDAIVKLGRIVNADEFYVNGKRVGNTTYEYPQREYVVPGGVLKTGKNLLVIRVTNNSGKGGFVPDKPYLIIASGDTIDLKGYWQYKVGEVFSYNKPNSTFISAQHQPTTLYNGMIAPITRYTIRGILWYQGESNASNPQAYKKMLPNLISDWRSQWKLGDIPFLIAQLPNFMEVDYSPSESNWAMIREVQLETALNTANTGLGINIDLGEWNDIHAGNKKPVGERLALAAMKISYRENNIVHSGPILKSWRIEGDKIILSFDAVGSGLVSGNGEELAHFAIAGEDKNFKWAKAEIKNNEVIVWCDNIPHPKFLRYGWADNPDFANLYNREGLPASPFRIAL